MASQRIETLLMEWFGNEWMRELVVEWKRKERGSLPGLVESLIFIYIISKSDFNSIKEIVFFKIVVGIFYRFPTLTSSLVI